MPRYNGMTIGSQVGPYQQDIDRLCLVAETPHMSQVTGNRLMILPDVVNLLLLKHRNENRQSSSQWAIQKLEKSGYAFSCLVRGLYFITATSTNVDVSIADNEHPTAAGQTRLKTIRRYPSTSVGICIWHMAIKAKPDSRALKLEICDQRHMDTHLHALRLRLQSMHTLAYLLSQVAVARRRQRDSYYTCSSCLAFSSISCHCSSTHLHHHSYWRHLISYWRYASSSSLSFMFQATSTACNEHASIYESANAGSRTDNAHQEADSDRWQAFAAARCRWHLVGLRACCSG
jgi:hypothetical protein